MLVETTPVPGRIRINIRPKPPPGRDPIRRGVAGDRGPSHGGHARPLSARPYAQRTGNRNQPNSQHQPMQIKRSIFGKFRERREPMSRHGNLSSSWTEPGCWCGRAATRPKVPSRQGKRRFYSFRMCGPVRRVRCTPATPGTPTCSASKSTGLLEKALRRTSRCPEPRPKRPVIAARRAYRNGPGSSSLGLASVSVIWRY